MSAQLSALVGVVVGAILAGAGSLLLAWRDETIQARTGVYLIRRILEEARTEVARLRGQKVPRWNPEKLPDSGLWSEYRTAVSARIALAKLRKIDRAMRNLDKLNESAARARKLGDEREDRIWEAALSEKEAAQSELEAAADPQVLDQPAIAALTAIEQTFEDALEDLAKVTPTGLPGRTWNRKSFSPWYLWHWRSITAAIVGVLLLVGFVWAGTSGTPAPSAVQSTLAAHLGEPAFTACEAVHDHEDDFSCVVVEKTTPTSCAAKVTASAAPRRVFAAETAKGSDEGSAKGGSCDGITKALGYTAQRQHDDNCTAFFETAISNVPAGLARSKPGFLRRVKALLHQDSESEDGVVPPVIVPGSAFTADC